MTSFEPPEDVKGPDEMTDEEYMRHFAARMQAEAGTVEVTKPPRRGRPLPPEVWPVPPDEALSAENLKATDQTAEEPAAPEAMSTEDFAEEVTHLFSE